MSPIRFALSLPVAVLLTGCARPPRAALPASADASGCRVEEVARVPGEDHFSFRGVSRDDRRIIIGYSVPGTQTRGSYILDMATGQRSALGPLNNGGSFSPDQRHVVAAVYVTPRNTDIVEYDLQTGRADTLAADPAADFLPSYSPDGNSIVFNSYRTGGSDVYLYDRRLNALRRLTSFDGYDAHAQFSPDAAQVVFHRQTAGANYDLVLLDLATGAERMLGAAPGEEAYPAFSPDGRYIVYSDDRARPGTTSLYVLQMSDRSSTRLLADTAAATYASWSANGRHIYFVSRRAGTSGVYRVRMDGATCAR
jgi:Tol biopolymer transport system component